jgi:hypothetical protein
MIHRLAVRAGGTNPWEWALKKFLGLPAKQMNPFFTGSGWAEYAFKQRDSNPSQ